MRLRLALLALLFLVPPMRAQERILSLDGYVVSIKGPNLTSIAHFDSEGISLSSGTADPVVSPNARYLAFTRDHSAFIASLTTRKVGAAKIVFRGNAGGSGFLTVDAYIVGFTPDSKSFYYSVAPGRDPCPDCPRHHIQPQKADYGLFLFDISSAKSRKIELPPNSRVHPYTSSARLYLTQVGSYSDELGLYDIASKTFAAFTKACSTALTCDLDSKSQHATCSQVINGQGQAIDCDLSSGTTTNLSPVGSCPSEFQHPLRSPNGSHVAYMQKSANCSGKATALVVDSKPAFKCEGLSNFLWVDDERLLLHCGDELVLTSIVGKKLGRMSAPHSDDRNSD